MTELDDRLREHFAGVRLSPAAIARLDAAARGAPIDASADAPADPCPLARRVRRLVGAWTSRPLGSAPLRWTAPRAAFACLLIAGLAVAMHLSGSLGERTERTLREVAMNHATRLTFEFEEDSLAGIDRHMRLLPFEMIAPGRLPQGTEVLGSRYCSLAGRLAAHVKLRDVDTGKPLSLFVTSVGPELERLDGDGGRIDGVEVELFREGGLFYALARHAG